MRAALLEGDEALSAWASFREICSDIGDLNDDAYRLLPQLFCNLRSLGVEDPVLGRLKGVYRRTWYVNNLLLKAGWQAVGQLQGAGIDSMLLYGGALLARQVRDIGARPVDSIGVLVRPAEAGRALRTLRAHGWSGAGKRSLKDAVVHWQTVRLAKGPYERLNLHWSLPFAGGYDEEVWASSVTVSDAGLQAVVPSSTDLLMLVCSQGLGWAPLRLSWILDAAFLVRSPEGTVDWPSLCKRSKERAIALDIADALEFLVRELGLAIPKELPAELRKGRGTAERRLHRVKMEPHGRGAFLPVVRHTARVTVLTRRLVGVPPAAWRHQPMGLYTLLAEGGRDAHHAAAGGASGTEVLAAVDASAGPEVSTAGVVDADRLWAFRRLLLESALVEIAQALETRGVHPLLMKGPAFARWLYEEPRERRYGDLDLLVGPEEFDAAMAGLVDLGFDPRFTYKRSNEGGAHHERLVRPGTFRLVVELHRTFALVPAAPSLVWRRMTEGAETIEIGAALVKVPSSAVSALIVSLHAAQHGIVAPGHWSQPLDDLRRALDRVDLVTWRGAAELAWELGAGPAFAAGLRLDPKGEEVAAELGLEAPDAREVRSLGATAATALSVERLASTRGFMARTRLLASELVPSRKFMRRTSPMARRGGLGLAAAYAWRPLRLASRLPRGVQAWLVGRNRGGQ